MEVKKFSPLDSSDKKVIQDIKNEGFNLEMIEVEFKATKEIVECFMLTDKRRRFVSYIFDKYELLLAYQVITHCKEV